MLRIWKRDQRRDRRARELEHSNRIEELADEVPDLDPEEEDLEWEVAYVRGLRETLSRTAPNTRSAMGLYLFLLERLGSDLILHPHEPGVQAAVEEFLVSIPKLVPALQDATEGAVTWDGNYVIVRGELGSDDPVRLALRNTADR